ncbi:MAG: transglutaminase family protein [Oscillibacter sp.]|nr:transglutaminase family protein [Oscillibacter sp.]
MARKPKIVVHTGREEAEPPAVAHLLLLLCGVCAVLLPSAEGLRYSVPRTILLAASLCACLWTTARIGWRWAVLCSMLCSAFWCAACVLLQDELSVQLKEVVRIMLLSSHADGQTVRADLCAALFAVLIVLLFFSSELLIGSHVIPFTLTLAVFLLGPLLGIHPSLEAAVLAALFQFGYWAMNGSGMRQSRFDFALPSRARLTAWTGGVTALLLAAVLLGAVPLAVRDNETLYAPAYAAEGFVKRSLSRLSGADANPVAGGKLNRGNQYPTGAAHLILTASRKPSQPVYLRGFCGSDYQYGGWDWDINSEVEIFRDMASEWTAGWDVSSEELRMITGVLYQNFEGMYWRLNRASLPDGGRAISMTVQRGGDKRYLDAYEPYYGAWRDNKQMLSSAATLAPAVSFYEQSDMAIDWEHAPDADDYRWIEEHYGRHIQSVYTQVPTERVPRLAKLCRDNPLTDLEEITAFILRTLQSRASYSLTPGRTPVTQDMAEYFLFENGLGYCQHFASAATLMYRLYGVPARYAAGYIAVPEDFFSLRAAYDSRFPSPYAESGEGEHMAVLTDFSAHAWPEIFLPGYGWTPIEVTPAADGSITPTYPGFNLELLTQRLADWDFAFPASGGRGASVYAGKSLTADFVTGMSRTARKNALDALKAAAFAAPFLTVATLYYRRRRRLALYASADCRVSFGRLLSMLRFSGAVPADCDGQEADFPARLSAAVPTIPEADAVRLRLDAQAAAYGSGGASQERDAFARELCQRAADTLYAGLNLWKRFLFRWGRVYG